MKRVVLATSGTCDDMLKAFRKALARKGVDSATSVDMLDAFNEKIDELEDTSSSVQASSGVYKDTQGQLGEVGAVWTEQELRDYWKNNHESDPVLQNYEDGDAWLKETLSYMEEVNSCDTINAAIDMQDEHYGAELVFDLIEPKVDRLTDQIEADADKYADKIREWDETYDLDGIGHVDMSFPLFVKYGLRPDVDYVGEPPYSVYVIDSKLPAWKEVIKELGIPGSIERFNQSYPEEEEAAHAMPNTLDVNSATDIMCDGNANTFMLMSYDGGDPESGMEADRFDCNGKFHAASLDDANAQLDEARAAGRLDESDYVTEYNSYFDDGEAAFDTLNDLLDSFVVEYGDDLMY